MKRQEIFRFMIDTISLGGRYKVGVVGATGAVGETVVKVLHERCFPISELHLYASPQSEGQWVETPYGRYPLELLNEKFPPSLDFVFLAAGREHSKKWGWRLARRNTIVIDKSSYFRDKDYAPLVVPEVNPEMLTQHRGVIANPNCTTIPLVTALAPLNRQFGLRRITAVTFQSVSGQGRYGINALQSELSDPDAAPTAFPHRIAFNVIPWIGDKGEDISGEEQKLIYESRRILNLPRLSVRTTSVRVPTMVGHGIAAHLHFRHPIRASEARKVLSNAPGITVIDDPDKDIYPTPLTAAGRSDVLVGRVRQDIGTNGLALWIVADNLRKGAAVNAVQIAELLIANNEKH